MTMISMQIEIINQIHMMIRVMMIARLKYRVRIDYIKY